MAKRIFISFAKEDEKYRDFLVGQAKNPASPFEFVDMSVKEPWDNEWKTKCKTKIKSCDGMIALISKTTKDASGACWEIRCAIEEGIPVRGMYIHNDSCTIPLALEGKMVVNWGWDNISNFLEKL